MSAPITDNNLTTQELPNQEVTPQDTEQLKVNGLTASDKTMDLVNDYGELTRVEKLSFLHSLTSRKIDNIIRIPVDEFITFKHHITLYHHHLTDLPSEQRVFVRFTLEKNNSQNGECYLALPIIQSGTDTPTYRPPQLSRNQGLVYKATRVLQKLSYEDVEKLTENNELNFEHCSPQIFDITSLRKTIVRRYSKNRTDLSSKEIQELGVAVVWYELIGYLEPQTNQIHWLKNESTIGCIAPQILNNIKSSESNAFVMIGGCNIDTQAVHQLLNIAGVKHQPSISGIQQAMSKKWRRATGEERTEMLKKQGWLELSESYEPKKQEIFSKISQLGLLDAIHPSQNEFQHILLLGARVQTMELRMKTLVDSTVNCQHLSLLAGQRELSQEELEYMQTNYATSLIVTEADAIKVIVEKLAQDSRFQNVSKSFVMTEHKLEQRVQRRANTQDTVEDWLKQHPHPISTLIVSNQPYAAYQNQVVRNVLSRKGYCQDVATLAAAAPVNPESTHVLPFLNAIDSMFRVHNNET